ncbi:pyrroline-5-carboxylate reductase [Celerinatantimonas yamalensis]|uniref:Pyrroline-5-carboxylate reductase n=1 Tax=Celerinatantimonas yamalensis TaxID=559956 RepID=A0ABW9G876_9GAMM
MATPRIVFIGAGHMAGSLIGGMIKQGMDSAFIGACDHNPPKLEQLQSHYGIQVYSDSLSALNSADVIVLAVKPQVMQALCETLKQDGDVSGKLFISVAAGITCSHLKKWLGDVPIVRCMPNLPAKVGLGVSGLYASVDTNAELRKIAEQTLECVGAVIWVEKEEGINHIIAAAGSAPAYFFLFMDAIQQYAQSLGFSEKDARNIVTQTALGSATLAMSDPGTTLAQMCQNVAVKGGTTAEAVRVFNQADIHTTVKKAMQAAIERSQQLEDQL